MKKLLLILLLTIPFLGFGQTGHIQEYYLTGQLESAGVFLDGRKKACGREVL